MPYLPYILFACFILYSFFGAYAYLLNPKGRANRLFLLVCVCYAVWAFSYTNMHSVETIDEALYWYRFSLPAKIFFSILIVQFFLSMTGARRRLRYPAYTLYAPGMLFLAYGLYTGGLGASGFVRQGSVWLEEYSFGDPVDATYYLWHALLMVLSLAIIKRWRRKAGSRTEKTQAGIMLVSGIPAVCLTLLANLLAFFGLASLPNIAPAAGVLWIGGIWFAVSKHGFLTITPGIAFDSILQSIAEGLVLTDPAGTVKWMNRPASDITGRPASRFLNSGIGELFKDPGEPRELFASGKAVTRRDTVFLAGDGGELHVLLSVSPVRRDDRLLGHVFSFQDISERKKSEEKIRYISYHDKLTGLYNRSFAEEELRRLDTARQLPLSVIICDVNGLKLANDFYGHIAGDRLIINAARCIRDSCRQEDIISRWGGDEFIVLLPQTPIQAAREIAERIAANCRETEKNPAPLSISSGVAAKTSPEEDINDVIKRADDIMYTQKLKMRAHPACSASGDKKIRNILIVEDEKDFAGALSLRLSSCGYSVRCAGSAGAGISLAKKVKPDLVLMDIMFPGEPDGYAAIESIRGWEGLERVPVIIISARTMRDDITKGLGSGADFYLTKPIDGKELIEKIGILEKNLSAPAA